AGVNPSLTGITGRLRSAAMRKLAALAATLLFACGGGSDPGTPDAVSTDWQPLIEKGWTLPPGGEQTSDLQLDTLAHAAVIGGLRPLAPLGTHHTLLFRGASGTNMIYASGVGTGELMFPEGKAMKIASGTLLGLQLHIFNQTDNEITGMSGIEMLQIDPA